MHHPAPLSCQWVEGRHRGHARWPSLLNHRQWGEAHPQLPVLLPCPLPRRGWKACLEMPSQETVWSSGHWGRWAILQTNLRSHSNPEEQRWWPETEMISVGEVLPPKTRTQGTGSVLRVLTSDPGLTLPPAGWVSEQGHFLLWACFFICMGVPTTFRILHSMIFGAQATARFWGSLYIKKCQKCQNRVTKIRVCFNSYNEQINPLNFSPHPTHYISTNHQWQQ